ncbi:cytochrome P450 [Dendrothele bispora CBS 962.96]|uniref:Cytochrome P450 n=1 Tax=Dendrothele bispora (strain CBS 962.96) TaxID=1314807 RepID=A0A4S8MBA7_DENBC|nr:cytochrome P450 [Dendrothele bispora CBS 962.96]
MAYNLTSIAVFIALLVPLAYATVQRYYQKSGFKLPPGPPAKLMVGNILHVPRSGAWHIFTEWYRSYGDLVYLHGLGNKVLVVNDIQAVNELFEKRWSLYSHRPIFTVVGELMGLDQSLALMPYGEEWRESRKLIHIALNPGAVKKYYGVQEDIAALLNKDLLDSPNDFMQHLRLMAGRIVLLVTYGIFAKNMQNQYIADAEECMGIIDRVMIPGAFLADLIPALKYLPSWVPFQKEVEYGKRVLDKTVQLPYLYVKEVFSEKIAPPSLTKDLLSLGKTDPQFNHRAMWATSTMYAAYQTFATTATFILAMALNIDVQKRAQAEIDEVLGSDHSPTILDAPKLPYTMAVIKETMRWYPVVPLSIPRRTAEDDIFKGCFIPKNTIVIPNFWAISRNTNDPERFNPDRFLKQDRSGLIPDPSEWAFGTGRRKCPGRYLGENSLIAVITGILFAFDIRPLEDEPIEPKFTPTNVSHPEPFKCIIQPRSQEKRDFINTRAAAVQMTEPDVEQCKERDHLGKIGPVGPMRSKKIAEVGFAQMEMERMHDRQEVIET